MRVPNKSQQKPTSTRLRTLSERERRFVDAYMGEAAGNATTAAMAAGYSQRNARPQGSRLLTKANIHAAIRARVQADPAVADREARQRLWTDIAFGRNGFAQARLRDRLKASELLGRSQADFVDRHHHEGTISTIDVDLIGARERLARLLANLAGKQ